jgi:ADP-ribose pyrophosphatase YjhB (NUDIX family)
VSARDVPVRRAVAAAIRRDGLVLAVRRPDEPGEELGGVWGLPAVTLGEDETPEEGVRRIGREKLGATIEPDRGIGTGAQQRDTYSLEMTVYEASLGGEPQLPDRKERADTTLYEAIEWLPVASFREAAQRGSLCCRLFLDAERGAPRPSSAP